MSLKLNIISGVTMVHNNPCLFFVYRRVLLSFIPNPYKPVNCLVSCFGKTFAHVSPVTSWNTLVGSGYLVLSGYDKRLS